jgi:hypothetical protein
VTEENQISWFVPETSACGQLFLQNGVDLLWAPQYLNTHPWDLYFNSYQAINLISYDHHNQQSAR